jgi:AcrR family transcriptional regulator
MSEKRSYRMTDRARSQDETRRRIVEATMFLHEHIGPRATTISAIAEKAGVQRLTVYRHFPDETAVFQACTAHWLGLNPPPDPADWAGISDGRARLTAALGALYGYYSGTRRMWAATHRDVEAVPALQGPFQEYLGYLAGIGTDLAARLGAGAAPDPVAATIHHALGFPAWVDLDDQGLNDPAKVRLAVAWVDGATASVAERDRTWSIPL